MESIKISFGASCAAAVGYFAFHRSRPAIASSFTGEFATTISGILLRCVLARELASSTRRLAREGATRGASCSRPLREMRRPRSIRQTVLFVLIRKRQQCFQRSRSSFMRLRVGRGFSAKRFGIVSTVNAAGSQSGTSCQESAASTPGHLEAGEPNRLNTWFGSLAFWL